MPLSYRKTTSVLSRRSLKTSRLSDLLKALPALRPMILGLLLPHLARRGRLVDVQSDTFGNIASYEAGFCASCQVLRNIVQLIESWRFKSRDLTVDNSIYFSSCWLRNIRGSIYVVMRLGTYR